MKDVFSIGFNDKNECEAVSVRKQNGRYTATSVKFPEEASETEKFVRSNAGRIIALFPFERTYFHEILISKKLSQKSLLPILKASTEAALPFHLNGHFHFDFPMDMPGKDERRLQLIADFPKDRFYEWYELEMIELQPAAFFEGFYRLFALPQDRKYFLYYQGPRYDLLATGKGGKMQKMRVIKKTQAHALQNYISNFLKEETVEACYSWCGEKEAEILSAFFRESQPRMGCKHLKNNTMTAGMQFDESHMEKVCHGIAFLEGFINPCTRVSPPRFSFIQGDMAKTGSRMLGLGALFMGIVFLYVCAQLNYLGRSGAILRENISKKFYSFFSPQTPLIDPVRQISALLQKNDQTEKLVGNILNSGVLLEFLTAVLKNKDTGQSMTRISLRENIVSVEGLYEDRNEIGLWAETFNGKAFGGLKVRSVRMEWPGDNHYRANFEYSTGD